MKYERTWTVELRHVAGINGAVTNRYTVPEALRVLAKWSPDVRAKARIVRTTA